MKNNTFLNLLFILFVFVGIQKSYSQATVNAGADQTICNGASVTLGGTPTATGTPPFTYSWSPGGSTLSNPTVNPTLTTTYTCTVIDGFASVTSDVVIVTVNPLPVVTSAPTTDSICSGIVTSLNLSSSVGGTSYSWTTSGTLVTGNVSGSGVAINQNLTTTSSSIGTAYYYITGITSGACSSSITDTVIVFPLPVATSTPSSQTICSGENSALAFTSTVAGTTFSWTTSATNVSGATSGAGSSVSETLTATSASPGTLTYLVTPTANGCNGTTIFPIVTVNPLSNIAGHVSFSGGNVTDGNAVLYKYIPSNIYFDTVMTSTLNASGNFVFSSPINDNYLVKVFPNTTTYPTLNPTYFGNEWAWDSTTVIAHGCSTIDSANIVMIENIGSGTGPGMLTGSIQQGAGFGALVAGEVRTPGDPIPGLDIKLGKNPGGAMVASTTTNVAGVYTFTGIDINTPGESYTVYVDIPGLGRDSSYTVILTAGSNQFFNLDYIADSSSVYILPNTAGVENLNDKTNQFSIYPNPTKGNATIEYNLLTDATVSLSIYSVLGVKVSELVNSEQKAGAYKYTVNSNDAHLDAGVYFIALITDGKTSVQRLIITK
ncbi:hypothetical protein BH10BAC1_BH10BAC1_05250 [soil metagenome]